MILFDVNVLVGALDRDDPRHEAKRAWLDALVNGREPFGATDLVLSGFLRVPTQPALFSRLRTTRDELLRAVEVVRSSAACRVVAPGPRHWDIFLSLCRLDGVQGKLVADAYHAATAIEHGCDWYTLDRDFERFPGLRVRYPDV